MNTNKTQAEQLPQVAVTSSFSLKNYHELDIKVLQKISFLLEKVETTFGIKDEIHEDIVGFMMKPFEDILRHHGVNISEQDF